MTVHVADTFSCFMLINSKLIEKYFYIQLINNVIY